MPSFIDNKSRKWTIEIDVNVIRAVRKETQVNLYNALADGFKGIHELLADPVMLCDVLWIICKDQAEKMSPTVTDEMFGKSLRGDAIVNAVDALVGGLIDFFPQEKARTNLAAAWAKSKEMSQHLMDAGCAELSLIDPAAEAAKLVARIKETVKLSSTDSPASSGLTPDHSRSAN